MTGHHWKPIERPQLADFQGTVMHSHSYRTPDFVDGQRVAIAGWGTSAYDIARDIRDRGLAISLTICSRAPVAFSNNDSNTKCSTRPPITRCHGKRVYFTVPTQHEVPPQPESEQQSDEEVDVIISCSGYEIAFPFLERDMLPIQLVNAAQPTSQYVRLWKYFVPPHLPNMVVLAVSNVGGTPPRDR
jgi:lysine/ornithine N-monooxygenase